MTKLFKIYGICNHSITVITCVEPFDWLVVVGDTLVAHSDATKVYTTINEMLQELNESLDNVIRDTFNSNQHFRAVHDQSKLITQLKQDIKEYILPKHPRFNGDVVNV